MMSAAPVLAADNIEVNEDISVSGDYDWKRFANDHITLNVYNNGLYISDGSDESINVLSAFEELTGINDNMVLDAPDIETVLPKFLEFSEGAVMVAHNASFDMSFIEHNCVLQGIEREFTTADTVAMARFLLPGLNRFKLDTVAKAVGVSLENHHRAVDDAGATAEILSLIHI